MSVEKTILNQLKKFALAFREARDRGANEADTVMFLVKFFEELLGYDSLKGEISKELQIKERYCDLALKIDGTVHVLVECKAASVKGLRDKDIEQAENYASRAGIRWVVLTNGIEWRLYHLSFAENEGIAHELAFEANLLEEVESNPEGLWAKLSLLSRYAVQNDFLEDYWEQKKALSPASVVRVLFSHTVLVTVRRELNRNAPARFELQDVFNAIRDILSKEALLAAGDITIAAKRRKKRRKIAKAQAPAGEAAIAEESGSKVSSLSFPQPCPEPAKDESQPHAEPG
jgi:hypothetical protein